MITIRPFKGWRPAEGKVAKVASPPYDVLSSSEARVMAEGNDDSFLHVTKPEIDLAEDVDIYDSEVYLRGKANWENFKRRKLFVQDQSAYYYLYRQMVQGHAQTGIVAASSIDDYFENRIKKHEFTRPKKENDRIAHMYHLGIHPGPVFLTYKNNAELQRLIDEQVGQLEVTVDFVADDGVQHTLWVVEDEEVINTITKVFREDITATYIADGHHRAAASAKVGQRLRDEENAKQDDRHNYFLSVLFPDNQLKIIDYNRLIKDLNGFTGPEFLDMIETGFTVSEPMDDIYKPSAPMEFGMYLEGKWYRLNAKPHTYDLKDPIKCLDVTALSNYLIAPILGIEDQRTDERIDFVGGIRGLGELMKRVDSGEMAVAFAIYPVSISQLIDIADAGLVMPPKSTWFEPKLRSGIVVHEFKD
jgi:uncharacterized protein (DUF1015 family)